MQKIVLALKDNIATKEIASQFGISKSLVNFINRGERRIIDLMEMGINSFPIRGE